MRETIVSGARQHKACEQVGLCVRTYQRWSKETGEVNEDKRKNRIFVPPHKLTEAEEAQMLEILTSPEFADKSPNQIVPILADRGVYIASESSFYRLLRRKKLDAHRLARRPAKKVAKPEALVANAPNKIWSWDITYLLTTVQGQYFYLYVFIDIFSRAIVGWSIHAQQNSELAAELVKDVCLREKVQRNQVTLHSDNGSPMKGATMLAMLENLGVARSLSRPAVSNDNSYSESVFATLKMRPNYPAGKPFENISDARAWVERFVTWYNTEHLHSGISFVTPMQRHRGEDQAILAARKEFYQQQKQQNPARWSGKVRAWEYKAEVTLNPDNSEPKKQANST